MHHKIVNKEYGSEFHEYNLKGHMTRAGVFCIILICDRMLFFKLSSFQRKMRSLNQEFTEKALLDLFKPRRLVSHT